MELLRNNSKRLTFFWCVLPASSNPASCLGLGRVYNKMGTFLPYKKITEAQVGDRLYSPGAEKMWKKKLFCLPWSVHGPGHSDFCPPGRIYSILRFLLTSNRAVTSYRNTSGQLQGDISCNGTCLDVPLLQHRDAWGWSCSSASGA